MQLRDRIQAFSRLGRAMATLPESERQVLFQQASNENGWFTPASLTLAFEGIGHYLDEHKLTLWTQAYSPAPASRKVGVVMAGNIPLVGFHDLLAVLISGHHLVAKLSSQDQVLMRLVITKLIELEPRFTALITLAERLNDVDAVIATGSDNTARYFEYYFRTKPHIIRKNRTACAIIQGSEITEEFNKLGRDVFSYFGLGCRNVSKIFIPEEFEVADLAKAWASSFSEIIHHHKWANNYDYQKAILSINQSPFIDTGFNLIVESKSLVSPLSVVFIERYRDLPDLRKKLDAVKEKIQCIVSARAWFGGSFAFGEAQLPGLDDYADGVDTMKFLSKL